MKPGRIPEPLLDAIRARVPLLDLVQQQVRMKRTGASWQGLCPFHGERRPSFNVRPATATFHCFGCGAHGDVFAWVMRTESRPFPEAAAVLAAQAGMEGELAEAGRMAGWAQPQRPAPAAPRPQANDDAERTRWAQQRWQAAGAIAEGSPQALYLAGRGLWPLPAAARLVLRAALGRHADTGEAQHPIMLARVDAGDGTLCAVHRTYLEPDGAGGWRKLGVTRAKMLLGPMRDGAIRLAPVAGHLALAEGIETALAAQLLLGLPAWACVSAGGLEALGLPFDVAEVTICADRDRATATAPEGRGLQAGRRLAARLRGLAVRPHIRMPLPPYGDYADVLAAKIKGEAA